jgi:hypothetical protein
METYQAYVMTAKMGQVQATVQADGTAQARALLESQYGVGQVLTVPSRV